MALLRPAGGAAWGTVWVVILMRGVWLVRQLHYRLAGSRSVWIFCRKGGAGFYDTRIFPLFFTHVLSEEQQKPLLRPVVFWAWQDMDSNSRGIKGSGTPQARDEKKPKSTSAIACWSI